MSVFTLFVPLIAVAALVTTTTGAVLSFAVRLKVLAPDRWRSSWLAASMPSLPVIAGALSLIALGVPRPLSGCHCLQRGAHDLHLCAFHPELAAGLFWPSALVLLIWCCLVSPQVLSILRSLRATARLVRHVRHGRTDVLDDTPIHLLDFEPASVFSLGVARPVIVADRLLWRALSADQRRAIVHHEKGHVERGDGVTLLALRLALAFCPGSYGERLVDGWRRSAERACDLRAADVVGDPSLVAEALIAVESVRGARDPRCGAAPIALGIADHDDLEQRVLALLDERSRKWRPSNDLLAVAAMAVAAALVTLAWPGSAFHRAVETLLGFFMTLIV